MIVLPLCLLLFHFVFGPRLADNSLGRAIAAPTQMEVVVVNYDHIGIPNRTRFVIRDPKVFAEVRQEFANRESAQLGIGLVGTKQNVLVHTLDELGNDDQFCFVGEAAQIWILGLPYYVEDSDGGPRTAILNACLAALENPAANDHSALVRVLQD